LHDSVLRRARNPEAPVGVAHGVADGQADALPRGGTTPEADEEAGFLVCLPHGKTFVVVLEIQLGGVVAEGRDPVLLASVCALDLASLHIDDLKIHDSSFLGWSKTSADFLQSV
jgi:hypothetical protein